MLICILSLHLGRQLPRKNLNDSKVVDKGSSSAPDKNADRGEKAKTESRRALRDKKAKAQQDSEAAPVAKEANNKDQN